MELKNKITWEFPVSNKSITWNTDKCFEKYVNEAKPKISTEEMIKKILPHIEDKGFFRDVLDWLKKMAPTKVEFFVEELHSSILFSKFELASKNYEKMCQLIHQLGFRTSEIIEQRMILGPNNKWIQEYFKIFPL